MIHHQANDIRISVIIPAHNSAQFLTKTLTSIKQQSHPPYEVIVIDDGSTDSTLEIAKQFQCQILIQKNQGPAAARNAGITVAQGNWIAFIDSDDLWATNKIEKTILFLRSNPQISMISTNMYSGNEESGWKKVRLFEKFRPKLDLFSQLYRRSFIATSTVVLKKDLLIENGLFDATQKSSEDLDLWLKIAKENIGFAILDDYLTYYRIRTGSLTSDLTKPYSQTKSILYKNKNSVSFSLFTVRIFVLNAEIILQQLKLKNYKVVGSFLIQSLRDLIFSPYFYLKNDSSI